MPEVAPLGTSGISDIQPQSKVQGTRIANPASAGFTMLEPGASVYQTSYGYLIVSPSGEQTALSPSRNVIRPPTELTNVRTTAVSQVAGTGGTFASEGKPAAPTTRTIESGGIRTTTDVYGNVLSREVAPIQLPASELARRTLSPEERQALGRASPGTITDIGRAKAAGYITEQEASKIEMLRSGSAQFASEQTFKELAANTPAYFEGAKGTLVTPQFKSGQEQLNYMAEAARQSIAPQPRATTPEQPAITNKTLMQNIQEGMIQYRGKPRAEAFGIFMEDVAIGTRNIFGMMGARGKAAIESITPEGSFFRGFGTTAVDVGISLPYVTSAAILTPGLVAGRASMGTLKANVERTIYQTPEAIISPVTSITESEASLAERMGMGTALVASFAVGAGKAKVGKIGDLGITTEKMFGKVRTAELRQIPTVAPSAPSEFITGSLFRPAIRETTIGKPTSMKVASYGGLEDIGFTTGDLLKPAIRSTGITAGAAIALQAKPTSAKQDSLSTMRNEAYNIASELSAGKPDIFKVDIPHSPVKVGSNLKVEYANRLAKDIADTMNMAGLKVESKGTKVIQKGRPSDIVVDVEYFDKQKIDMYNLPYDKLGLDKFDMYPNIAMSGKYKFGGTPGDIGILGKFYGNNFIDTPLMGINLFKSEPLMPGQALLRGAGRGNIPMTPAERMAKAYQENVPWAIQPKEKSAFIIASSKGKYTKTKKSRGAGFEALQIKWAEREAKAAKEVSKGTPKRTSTGQILLQKQEQIQEQIQKPKATVHQKKIQKQTYAQTQKQIPSLAELEEIRLRLGLQFAQGQQAKNTQLQYVSPMERVLQGTSQALKQLTRTATASLQSTRTAIGTTTATATATKTAEATRQAERTAEATRTAQRERTTTQGIETPIFKFPFPPTERKKRKHVQKGKGGYFQTFRATPLIEPLAGLNKMFKSPAKRTTKKSKKGRR